MQGPIFRSADAARDDWAFVPVPHTGRHPLHRTVAEWIGFSYAPVAIATAIELASRLPFATFLLTITVGSFLLAAASAASGYVAQRTGLTFGLLSRLVFGSRGFVIPCAIVPLSLVGWNSFNLAIMAEFTGQFLGTRSWYPVLCFAYMLLFAPAAMMGFKWISRISIVTVPGMAILLLVGAVMAIQRAPSLSSLWPTVGQSPSSLATALTAVVGLFALGTSVSSPDIQRFCRSGRDAVLTAFLTFGVGFPLLLLTGAICGIAAGEASIASALSKIGAGTLGFVLFLLLTWTTADNDYYSASLGFARLTGLPRRWMVLVAALPAAFIGAMNLQEHLLDWLVLMSTISTPMAGLIVADYFLARDRWKLAEQGKAVMSEQPVRIGSYVSWACGALTVYLTGRYSLLIPPLNGMAVAFAIQALVLGSFRRHRLTNTGALGV